jgi:hypothetical protein
MGSVDIQMVLDHNLSDGLDAHVQPKPIANPARRTLRPLRLTSNDFYFHFGTQFPIVAAPMVD